MESGLAVLTIRCPHQKLLAFMFDADGFCVDTVVIQPRGRKRVRVMAARRMRARRARYLPGQREFPFDHKRGERAPLSVAEVVHFAEMGYPIPLVKELLAEDSGVQRDSGARTYDRAKAWLRKRGFTIEHVEESTPWSRILILPPADSGFADVPPRTALAMMFDPPRERRKRRSVTAQPERAHADADADAPVCKVTPDLTAEHRDLYRRVAVGQRGRWMAVTDQEALMGRELVAAGLLEERVIVDKPLDVGRCHFCDRPLSAHPHRFLVQFPSMRGPVAVGPCCVYGDHPAIEERIANEPPDRRYEFRKTKRAANACATPNVESTTDAGHTQHRSA